MRQTLRISLPADLMEWLEVEARRSGLSLDEIVRAELEKARDWRDGAFMKLAGRVEGSADLSLRDGFARR